MHRAKGWPGVLREASAVLAGAPRLRWWWRVAAAIAIVRLVLLGAFMADARYDLGALPGDAFYKSHSCLTAYWRAAALARDRAVNLYDPALYENLTMDGFGVDAYVYPPPFLLLPTAAAVIANDFRAIRAGWFVVELGLFLWAFGLVAIWIGGRPGARCLLWLPAIVTGLPVLLGLQMGNFHLAALALAMLGMLAVEEDRPGWAGFWMALAIGAKVFPAILLVVLAGRRKPKPILWAIGWLVVQTAMTVVLFGPAPLKSFLDFQLPQLVAVDTRAWEAPGLFGTVNSSIFGLALKARALGIPIGPVGASALGMVYGLAVLAAAAGAGVRVASAKGGAGVEQSAPEERLRSAQSWLAFLGLGSLRAPFLPDAYAGAVALWLLALVSGQAGRKRLAWIVFAFLMLWPVLPSRIAVSGFEGLRSAFSSVAHLVFLVLVGGVALCALHCRSAGAPTSSPSP